jgi:plasmid maintenance system antidote protein VapI
MVLRFTRLTGRPPELYLNMQTGHDLEAARQSLDQPARPAPYCARLGRVPQFQRRMVDDD